MNYHYAEAEQLLRDAADMDMGDRKRYCVEAAQVHATLALAARDEDDTPVPAALRAAIDGLNELIGGRSSWSVADMRCRAADVLARVKKIRDGQS